MNATRLATWAIAATIALAAPLSAKELRLSHQFATGDLRHKVARWSRTRSRPLTWT